MNVLAGIKQTRNRILKQYTVADIMAMDDWFLEQSLDTAANRAKLMESLEKLDRRKERLFKDALKGQKAYLLITEMPADTLYSLESCAETTATAKSWANCSLEI